MSEKLEYIKTLEKEVKQESELPSEIQAKIKELNGKIKGVAMSQGRYNSKPTEANLNSLNAAQFDVKTRDIEISDMILDWIEKEEGLEEDELEVVDTPPAESAEEKKKKEEKEAADKLAADAQKKQDEENSKKQQEEQQSANSAQAIRDLSATRKDKRVTISDISRILGEKITPSDEILVGTLKLERCWMSSTDYEIVK